jgi:hypothetical protein
MWALSFSVVNGHEKKEKEKLLKERKNILKHLIATRMPYVHLL